MTDLERHGGWWCKECAAVRSLDVSGVQSVCARCGSARVKWLKPICNQAEPSGLAMRLSPAEAHVFFERMRAELQ